MRYKILRESTTSKLEEAINNIAETHKPSGNMFVDSTKCLVLLMVEK